MLKINYLKSGGLSGPTRTLTSTETIGDTMGRRDACWIHLFWSSTTHWALFPMASLVVTFDRHPKDFVASKCTMRLPLSDTQPAGP